MLRINAYGTLAPMKLLLIHDLLSVLMITQSRLLNIPLFLIFQVALQLLLGQDFTSVYPISFTILIMQHVAFFALGNSNSISSIDLSNAYNGVSGYNVGVVGILTF